MNSDPDEERQLRIDLMTTQIERLRQEIATIDARLPDWLEAARNPDLVTAEIKNLRSRRGWLAAQLAGFHYGMGNSGPRVERP